jgi:hypothetical protein
MFGCCKAHKSAWTKSPAYTRGRVLGELKRAGTFCDNVNRNGADRVLGMPAKKQHTPPVTISRLLLPEKRFVNHRRLRTAPFCIPVLLGTMESVIRHSRDVVILGAIINPSGSALTKMAAPAIQNDRSAVLSNGNGRGVSGSCIADFRAILAGYRRT